MKKLFLPLILSFLSLNLLSANQTPAEAPAKAEKADKATKSALPKLPWIEDFEEAKKLATERKSDILMDFTGSDWCSFCQLLTKEVFTNADFVNAAKDKFVYLELDYPQEKKQPANIEMQNEKLSAAYKVEGFPTVILADAKGTPYARTGWEEGGAKAYLEKLAELQQVRAKRDAAMDKAAKLEGLEKAKALKEGLDTMEPDLVTDFYESVINEIVSLDKDDTLGLKKEQEYNKALAGLDEGFEVDKPELFLKAVDDFIAKFKPTKEKLQTVMMFKLQALGDNLPAAKTLLEDVIKIDAKTPAAENAIGNLEQVKELLAQEEKEGKGNGKDEGKSSGKEKAEAPPELEIPEAPPQPAKTGDAATK